MNIVLDVQGLRETQQALVEGFSDRRFGGAMATALSRTASETQQAIREKLPTVFDRPTPWTIGGVGSSPAQANRLSASVFIRDRMNDTSRGGRPAAVYLKAQIDGGSRRLKGIERLLQARGLMPKGWKMVPGRTAILDAYGNFNTNWLTQVLSQLRVGKKAKPIALGPKRLRTIKRTGGYYFTVLPGDKRGLKPGIVFSEIGTDKLQSVIRFVPNVNYPKRFDFAADASKIALARLGPNVNRALDEATRSLRSRDLGLRKFGLLGG